jgi:hypothetical protein
VGAVDRQWIVHITDLCSPDGVHRCVRCACPLQEPDAPWVVPGTLLAVRTDSRCVEWRRILERDDLAGDEVFCDRVLLRDRPQVT